MRVEQNNFRDMFSVYLSVTEQAQHVFCVSPAARVTYAGLTGEEGLEDFPLQAFQHGDVSLPRKSPAHGASALHVSVDGHGVSGSQHNQNNWLIAYFAPYRWLRFTGVINEKATSPGEDAA